MRTLRRHDQKDPSEGSQLPRAGMIALSVSVGRCDDQDGRDAILATCHPSQQTRPFRIYAI
jgi:hypothetical protein